jgi:chorismate mutase/prephenate dehydratase
MSELSRLRARLDEIDRRLVDALAERLGVVGEVARHKGVGTAPPRDEAREQELLERVEQLARGAGVDGFFARSVYRLLLDHSVRVQEEHLVARDNPGRDGERLVIGYQGTDGCYSHIASMAHVAARGGAARFRGYEGFRPMLDAVAAGEVDLALLPIENTTAGTLTESYDLLARMDLAVVGEEYLRVRHCLIALQPVPIANIRRVRSHPMALAQCTRFLDGLRDCLVERYPDTAMACDALLFERDLSQAAIASEEAAVQRGLAILARDIGDQEDNVTRFVAVARAPIAVDRRLPCKTSVVIALRHEQGALFRCLQVLVEAGLNLAKLESRPRPGHAWEYLFYVDFEGNAEEPRTAAALARLAEMSPWMKVLGSYPRRDRPAEPPG